MSQITTNELKARVEAGDPLTVLDIREQEMFTDWHIPGAINLPVIRAIRAGDASALEAGVGAIPADQTVVVVCNEGVSSVAAVGVLGPLGFDAVSLAGGMRGWSAVWSEARGALATHPDATFIQIRRNGKGCLSYLLASEGVAVVFDPAVDESVYLDIARREDARIIHVLETHVHADHISRARSLCRHTGADLVLAPNDRVQFPYTPIADGKTITAGAVAIAAVATPGHTGESTSYLAAGEALFTGDTLFVDSVGRPDLEHGDAGAAEGARRLYHSLQERIMTLADDVRVYPAHTAEPIGFDGVVIAARLADIRGLALLALDEETFVRRTLDAIGPKPPSFTSVIEINEGRADLGTRSPLTLEAGPNRCAVGKS